MNWTSNSEPQFPRKPHTYFQPNSSSMVRERPCAGLRSIVGGTVTRRRRGLTTGLSRFGCWPASEDPRRSGFGFLGHALASVLSCIPEPCVSVGCCTRCWTTAPSAARRGPKVRGQCKVWVALPRAGSAHARTRACSRPLHGPQGWPGTPRSSRLHPGCHHASKEAHAWSCRDPGDPKGFVGACLPGTSQEAAQLPSPPPPILATKNVEGIASRVAFRGAWCCKKPGSVSRFCLEGLLSSVPCHLAKGLCLLVLCGRKPHLPIWDF